jgi:hypothetical protein
MAAGGCCHAAECSRGAACEDALTMATRRAVCGESLGWVQQQCASVHVVVYH